MPAELWVYEADGYWRTSLGRAYSARENLAYGTYRPSASTTGILSDVSALTIHVGNLWTSYPGQIIENLWVKGKIQVKHPNVTIRNCYITGDTAGPSSPAYSAITAYDALPGSCNVYDCTIEASVLTVYSGNGAQGQSINVYRCDISGFVDGIGFMDQDCEAAGNWIHDLPRYEWSPSHSDGSHNDCIQLHGGHDFSLIGNSLEASSKGTSAVIITQDRAATSNVLIDRNWLISTEPVRANATATGLNITNSGSGGGGAPMSNITITNNQFSALETWRVNHAGLVDRTTFDVATITGNVYVGTATQAKITRN